MINPARTLALQALKQITQNGFFASGVLDKILIRENLSDLDRGLLTQIVYGSLRELGFLKAQLMDHLDFNSTPKDLILWLFLSLYQMLFLTRVPDHAVLFEAVELAKKKWGSGRGRLVNGILRKVQRERESWLNQRHSPEGHASNFPQWLVKRWQSRYGRENSLGFFKALNQVPYLYARVNRTQLSVASLQKELRDRKIESRMMGRERLLALPHHSRESIQSFWDEGKFSYQDAHSFEVVRHLGARAGERGLDACAGHGNKLAAIAEELGPAAEGDLFYHEPAKEKVKALKKNFNRLHLKNPMQLTEKTSKINNYFDWVLLDAPCSGLGTLGRKPEIRWRVQEKDLLRLQKIQRQIIKTWAPSLKVGGRLIYSVCSLEPEESEGVLRPLGQGEWGGEWQRQDEGSLMPGMEGADGFFYSKWLRVA